MKRAIQYVLITVFAVFLFSPATAEVRLPAVIGDHMVLQQGQPIELWGWASSEEAVSIRFEGNRVKIRADRDGRWRTQLPAMKAGGPYTMTIKGENELILKNILVGEVWLCSGQSNMEWRMRSVIDNREEINAASHPGIRLFRIPRRAEGYPQDDVDAEWWECDPTTVVDFSGVAYFFGRMLHEKLNVPVGLIQTAWGGTRIEPWTPPEGFASVPELADITQQIQTAEEIFSKAIQDSLVKIENWVEAANVAVAENKPVPEMPGMAEHPLGERQRPTALYNGQVHALVPFGVRGFIWYQGEANRKEGMLYFHKMKALINGWRSVWGNDALPFYFVQLAPYGYSFTSYGDTNPYYLAEVREAQRKSLEIPNTGMVVTTDVGNIYDIHPRNKQCVGRRLALWALAKTYGVQDIVYSGPLYSSMRVVGDRIRISFDHTGSGLASNDGKPLTWFEIAGQDNKFVRAEAVIKGDEVEVWSSEVSDPAAVRFGWHENAVPNLANKEGLPASPFHTGI